MRRGSEHGLRYNFHRGHRRAWKSQKRFVTVLAGTQSGKTEFGPPWLHREIAKCGPGDYLAVGPTYPLLSLKVIPAFLRLFKTILNLGEFVASPIRKFTFSPDGERRTFGRVSDEGTHVYFGHATDPDALESATAKAAWLDESGQKKFKLASYQAILRRLEIHQGRVLQTTTPYNLGWLKQKLYDPWLKAGRNHPDIDVINFSSLMNPIFPRAGWDRAQRDLPRWQFDMFYRGIFTRPAGLIFDCFTDAMKVPPFKIPDAWERFVGLDFGGINTAATFWAKEPKGPYYAYREYWPRVNRTAAEHVAEVLKGEPRLPTAAGGSGSEDQWRREFAQAGLSVREPPVKEVEVGIQRAYGAINRGEVRVFSDLEHTLDELGSYSRVLDDMGQATEKIDDKESYHLIDSCRYLFSWLARAENRFDVGTAPGVHGNVLDELGSAFQ